LTTTKRTTTPDQTARHATRDAIEFGLHVKQGGWRLGLLVARNVVKAPGRISAETLLPKVSATEFARRAQTSNDRVLRYLAAWERAADANIVPHADILTPGLDPAGINVDTLPAWSNYYRPTGLSPVERQARDDARAAAAAQQAEARRQEYRLEVAARLNSDPVPPTENTTDTTTSGIDRLREELDAHTIADAGRTERERRAHADADIAAAEAELARTRVQVDIIAEAAQVTAAIRSYTRRLFDLSRDPAWGSEGREPVAESARNMAQQLTVVAGLIDNPDSGRATDDALNELLNGG
jgi:hypothetical protein